VNKVGNRSSESKMFSQYQKQRLKNIEIGYFKVPEIKSVHNQIIENKK
jgi:hypothetical protein